MSAFLYHCDVFIWALFASERTKLFGVNLGLFSFFITPAKKKKTVMNAVVMKAMVLTLFSLT
jgi:hypothetical protein